MFYLKDVKYKNILDIQELKIEDNKVTSIIGESGSGKTTLLRLLNKLISCDSGYISYKGKNIENIDSIALRRKVTMLPQEPPIFKGTIRDNLLIGLKFTDKPLFDDSHLYSILSFINLKKNLDDLSDNLSGGEKQRLALGRILLLDPDVFLLDEPSSALDEETEKFIIENLVKYTKENNKTLIMITHSKKIALSYSDRIIDLSKGSMDNREAK